MSISGMMSAALTGLETAQTALTTVSNNITNVNTPGFVQEVVQQSPAVAGGAIDGVTVDDVQRVTSQFLESANYQAASSAGAASVISNLLTQAQSAFGDPTQATSYLNQLSTVFGDFTAAANDPASSLPRTQIVDDLNTFLDSTQTVSGTLSGLQSQSQSQITNDVGQANQLLSQISTLNKSIITATAQSGSAAGSQDSQAELLQQLSSLMSINVTTLSNGSVAVQTSNGQLLVGNGGAATLSYTPSATAQSSISITPANSPQASTLQVGSGELQGLLSLSNTLIPGIQSQLSTYVGGAMNALNAASNASTAAPPPQTLTGRNTGLDLPTIVGDFTGTTNIAIVNSSGALQQQVAVNFTNDTMSVNSGAPASFTPSTFLSSLNTALGGTGTASFSNGALSISATTAGSGVAIADDATTPAQDGGQGFSQFFGLNDLVTSNQITNYNTGLQPSDASGFTPGGVITFELTNSSGAPLATVPIAMPPASAPTMQDLLTPLNAPIGGVGQYGSFSLNSNGALTFTSTSPGTTLSVASDTTQRGADGPSLSELFGVGAAQQSSASSSYEVNPAISANPMNMPLATLDLSAASGTPVVAIGDGSGAAALAAAASAQTSFGAAGGLPAMTTTVAQYAANLAGALGQQTSAADSADTTAAAVQTEAQTRLQSVEGVNLDQELVNLTTFQQAYNASARLVQASQNMITTLLDIIP